MTKAHVAAALVLGFAAGIPTGYVINDITSKENAEVVQEIRETEALQDDLDSFLNNLPAPGSGSAP